MNRVSKVLNFAEDTEILQRTLFSMFSVKTVDIQ